MNGFEKRREQKKQQILDSLKSMIMERNFQAIGVREIAAQAGVSPASIYNFFGSKEELAKQIVYRFLEEAGKEFEQLIHTDVTFEEKLAKLYDLSVTQQEAWSSDGIKNVMLEDPAFQAYIEQYTAANALPVLMELISQGKKEGKIAANISAEAILFYMNAITVVFSNPEVKERMSVELRKEIGHLFYFGILGRQP